MAGTEKTVATPSDAQAAMVAAAALPRTLVAGTEAMRAAKETYLPKEPAESQKSYENRLKRSTLFNAFGKTVVDMVGKVFDKPLVLKEGTPQQIVDYADNIDNAGRSLNVFARDAFEDAMTVGVGYILADMPPAPERVETQAEAKAAGRRPYLTYIPVEQLLGWKTEVIAGVATLTQVRIMEFVTEQDGPFHEKSVAQVRVLEPGKWTTYRKSGKDEKWTEDRSGPSTLQKITLIALYTGRTGFMTGAPPLQRLAELNCAHWQMDSDLRSIAHVVNVPVLFAAGFEDDSKIEVGASAAVRNANPAAKLSYVTHDGAAIGVTRDLLQDLETRMQAMGLQLLVSQPGAKTATGEMRDDSKENSPLAIMADGLGDALEIALGFMAEYAGIDGKGIVVDVNKDFGIAAAAAADVPNLISAKSAGIIDHATVLTEFKRRNFLAADTDIEAVIGKTEAEAPELDADPLDLDEDDPPQPKPAGK